MDRIISEQAVIESIEFYQMNPQHFNFVNLIDDIKEIPSAEPKIGNWVEKEGWDGDLYYECSVCGEPFCLIDGTPTDNMYNYCPNCGAKMVEPQESEE